MLAQCESRFKIVNLVSLTGGESESQTNLSFENEIRLILFGNDVKHRFNPLFMLLSDRRFGCYPEDDSSNDSVAFLNSYGTLELWKVLENNNCLLHKFESAIRVYLFDEVSKER